MNGITEVNEKSKLENKSPETGVLRIKTLVFVLTIIGGLAVGLGGGILIGRYLIPNVSETATTDCMSFGPGGGNGEMPSFDGENPPELPNGETPENGGTPPDMNGEASSNASNSDDASNSDTSSTSGRTKPSGNHPTKNSSES